MAPHRPLPPLMRQSPTTPPTIQLQEAESPDKSREARACPLCGRIGSRGYDDVRHLNSQMHYKYRPLICPLSSAACGSRELPNMRALLEHFHNHVAHGGGEQLSNAWKRTQGALVHTPPIPPPAFTERLGPTLRPVSFDSNERSLQPEPHQSRVWPHSFMNPAPEASSSWASTIDDSELTLPPLLLPVRAMDPSFPPGSRSPPEASSSRNIVLPPLQTEASRRVSLKRESPTSSTARRGPPFTHYPHASRELYIHYEGALMHRPPPPLPDAPPPPLGPKLEEHPEGRNLRGSYETEDESRDERKPVEPAEETSDVPPVPMEVDTDDSKKATTTVPHRVRRIWEDD